MPWTALRAQLPFLERAAYFDYALRGLVPTLALQASASQLRQSTEGRRARGSQEEVLTRLRSRVLRLLRADPEHAEVCLTANTTTAIALLAQSVRWKRGDRVVIHEDEAPGNRHPWEAAAEAHDLELVVLPSRAGRLDLEDLEEACRAPVRWASFAAISLATGERRPLEQILELVRAGGGRLCVDAAQGLGCVPLTLPDALAGCGRKWLCGPPEVGLLVLPNEVAESLRPITRGGCSGPHARLLEGGVASVIAAAGLEASLGWLESQGWEAIYARLEERRVRVEAVLLEAGLERAFALPESARSPLQHFALANPRAQLEAICQTEEVHLRSTALDCVRVSAHVWTSDAELERLARALRR